MISIAYRVGGIVQDAHAHSKGCHVATFWGGQTVSKQRPPVSTVTEMIRYSFGFTTADFVNFKGHCDQFYKIPGLLEQFWPWGVYLALGRVEDKLIIAIYRTCLPWNMDGYKQQLHHPSLEHGRLQTTATSPFPWTWTVTNYSFITLPWNI